MEHPDHFNHIDNNRIGARPSRLYEGLCIGGPLAGQALSHWSAYYSVPLLDDPLPLVERASVGPIPHYRVYTYQHELLRERNASYGIWIEKGARVLPVLLEVYAQAMRRLREGAQHG